MDRDYVLAWAAAFVFTQCVETPIYRFGYRASWAHAFAASAITHPLLWFVFFGRFGAHTGLAYGARVVIGELFVWLLEAVYLAHVSKKPRALEWSFTANLASVVLGLVSRTLLDFP